MHEPGKYTRHERLTFKIDALFGEYNEQVCRFLADPFTVADDGTIEWLPKPPDEKREELLRDAEAHARIEEFNEAILDAEQDAEHEAGG